MHLIDEIFTNFEFNCMRQKAYFHSEY